MLNFLISTVASLRIPSHTMPKKISDDPLTCYETYALPLVRNRYIRFSFLLIKPLVLYIYCLAICIFTTNMELQKMCHLAGDLGGCCLFERLQACLKHGHRQEWTVDWHKIVVNLRLACVARKRDN